MTNTNFPHTLVIDGESFGFSTAELAAKEGYAIAKHSPEAKIQRYNNGRLVSTYSKKMGWL